MRIAIPKETHPGENRIPITPAHAKKLCAMGADLVVEAGHANTPDVAVDQVVDWLKQVVAAPTP